MVAAQPPSISPILCPFGTRLLFGLLPAPSHRIKRGEAIPTETKDAMKYGDTVMMQDEQGEPCSIALLDHFGYVKEMPIKAKAKP